MTSTWGLNTEEKSHTTRRLAQSVRAGRCRSEITLRAIVPRAFAFLRCHPLRSIVFGTSKLPELGRAVGEGIRDFQRVLNQPPAIEITPLPSAGRNSAKLGLDEGSS